MEPLWRTKQQAIGGVFLPLVAICAVAAMTQDVTGRIVLAGLALLFIGFKILLKRADARRLRDSQVGKNESGQDRFNGAP